MKPFKDCSSHSTNISWLATTSIKLCSATQSYGTLWTVAHQAPLSMGFFRQKYWSGLPFPSSGDHPTHSHKKMLCTLTTWYLTFQNKVSWNKILVNLSLATPSSLLPAHSTHLQINEKAEKLPYLKLFCPPTTNIAKYKP